MYVSAERGIIFVKLWFALAPLVYVNIVSEDEYEDLAKKKDDSETIVVYLSLRWKCFN